MQGRDVLASKLKLAILILRKISKTVATNDTFKAKNAINSISAGARPRPRWGNLQRCRDPLAGFKGPTSKARQGKERRGREGREKRRVREGRPVFFSFS